MTYLTVNAHSSRRAIRISQECDMFLIVATIGWDFPGNVHYESVKSFLTLFAIFLKMSRANLQSLCLLDFFAIMAFSSDQLKHFAGKKQKLIATKKLQFHTQAWFLKRTTCWFLRDDIFDENTIIAWCSW